MNIIHQELKTVYEKSNLTDVRILNALMDFADDLHNLFESTDNTEEPEYNDFKSCFDQGLSQKEIDAKYKFESLKDFKQMSTSTLLGQGNTTPALKTKKSYFYKNRNLQLLFWTLYRTRSHQ